MLSIEERKKKFQTCALCALCKQDDGSRGSATTPFPGQLNGNRYQVQKTGQQQWRASEDFKVCCKTMEEKVLIIQAFFHGGKS